MHNAHTQNDKERDSKRKKEIERRKTEQKLILSMSHWQNTIILPITIAPNNTFIAGLLDCWLFFVDFARKEFRATNNDREWTEQLRLYITRPTDA